MRSNPLKFSLLLVVPLLALLASCASRPTLRVNYLMNPQSDALAERKAAVRVVDERSSMELATPAALDKIDDFTGYFALALSGSDQPQGIYDLTDLFKAAMTRKMENIGMTVLPHAGAGDVVVEIGIREFLLDLSDFKWRVVMNIEARRMEGEIAVSRQSVTGRAERVRFPRDKGADRLIGEIFTDVMSRVDMEELMGASGI